MMAKVVILGVPMDLGGNRRGVDMGPYAVRASGLFQQLKALGHQVTDGGNIPVPVPEEIGGGPESARFLKEVAEVCEMLYARCRTIHAKRALPVTLGGDHSIAVGTIAASAAAARDRGGEAGLLWFDAHGDMNSPETSPSGNVHGMPFASVLGREPRRLARIGGRVPMVRPERCALVGVRNLDSREAQIVRESGVRVFTMRDIDERRMANVMKDALAVVTDSTEGFHVSFDMDFVDPTFAPGVGTPVKGGVTYREAHLAMEMVADAGGMLALDMVEINALVDRENITGALGAELIASALGKKIL